MVSTAAWPSQPVAALDAETTGTDPLADRCVEIAVVLVSADGTQSEGGHHTLVDPGVPVAQDAVDVHGITEQRMRCEGVPPADALKSTVAALQRCAEQGLPLVIFNARFDWPLMLAEGARAGVTLPRLPLIDPLVIDRSVAREREGKRTLDALAWHYGVERGAAHTAVDDALCAARLAQAMAAAHPAIANAAPEALHRLQAGWFVEWRDSFNVFLRQQGEGREVTGEWPLSPGVPRRAPVAHAPASVIPSTSNV